MDDPNDSVSPRPGHGTRLTGLPVPSGSPFFRLVAPLRPRHSNSRWWVSLNFLDRDTRSQNSN